MADVTKKNLKYTLSTQAIEQAIPSKEAIKLCEHMSQGKVTADAAVDLLKKKYGISDRTIRRG